MTRDPRVAAFVESVGLEIAFARGARGIRGIDLARRIGVTKAAVSNWERGHAPPTLAHLYAIARELGIPPRDLLPASLDDDADSV